MRRLLPFLFVLVAAVNFTGCATTAPKTAAAKTKKPGPNEPPPNPGRIVYRGFSLARPSEAGWQVKLEEQSPTRGVIRHDPTKTGGIAIVAATLQLLERAPQSQADFTRLVRPDLLSDPALKNAVYTPKPTLVAGQWAVEYELTTKYAQRDGTSGTLRNRGLVIRHPLNTTTALHVLLSQRGAPAETDKKIAEEGWRLVESAQPEAQ